MQGEESIENQIDRCKHYLQFKGFKADTAEVISDIASGADDGRKGLSQLMEKINNKEIDVLIVTELSRLSRKIKTLINIIEAVKSNDIVIIAVIQNIDTATPMGKAMILMTGLFAELERNFIVERTQGGKLAKIESGDLKAIGGRPKKLSEKAEEKLAKDILKGQSINELAKKYEVSRATISRYKRKIK